MSKFPMFFEVTAEAESGIAKNWTAKALDLDPIPVAIPPEFSGPGKGYSPEDLFAMACVNCIIATFKVYAEHTNVHFEHIQAKAVLSLDKHPSENFLSMTNIDITFHLKGTSDKEKAKATLEKAIKDCAVCNSIKSSKTYHINVE